MPNPFAEAGKWLDPNRISKQFERHQKLVDQWRRVQDDLADMYENPDEHWAKFGAAGADSGEMEAELLEAIQNIEAELIQLRQNMRKEKLLLPPPSQVPPLLLKRLRLMGEGNVFAFDTVKPTRKRRFKIPEEGGASGAFPVTVSWVTAPNGYGITDNESVTLTGEGTFNLPGSGSVTVFPPDEFGNVSASLNGEMEVWIYGEVPGWYISDSEFWQVSFS